MTGTSFRLSLVTTCLLLGLCAPNARALSPEEKLDRASQELIVQEQAKVIEQKCGTKLAIHLDWASFTNEELRKAPGEHCVALLHALESLCAGNHLRAYVRKHVKSFVCLQSARDPGGLEVRRGELRWQILPFMPNVKDIAYAELLRKL